MITTQHLAANNFQWNGGEQNVASRSQFTRVRIAEKILSNLFIAEFCSFFVPFYDIFSGLATVFGPLHRTTLAR